jgi:hypothetical protein
VPVARPSRYPQVAATPGGNFLEPTSGVRLGGWPTGAVYPSSDANWLWRQVCDWNRLHDASRLASTDILAATVCRVSSSPLDIDTGTGLTGVITSGGVYYGAGERIDLTDAASVYTGGASLVFPAASVSYVMAQPHPSSGDLQGASCGKLLVSATDVVAGYVAIKTVTTDATDITVVADHSAVSSYLAWTTVPNFTAGLRGSDADLTGDLVAATVTTGYIVGSHGALGGSLGDPTLVVQGGGDANDALLITGTSTGRGLYAYSNGGSGTVVHIDAASFSASGKALTVAGNGTQTAVEITAGANRRGLLVTGSASSPYAAEFERGTTACIIATAGSNGIGGLFYGDGSGVGVGAYSGNTAGTNAIAAVTTNATGYPFFGQTSGSATTATAAARLIGLGSAAGVDASSVNFYAALLTSKTSSPTYGTIKVTAQTSYPSVAADGMMTYASSTFGDNPHWVRGSSLDGGVRGMWDSVGGFTYAGAYNQSASNADNTTYTVLASATSAAGNIAKQTGVVRITVTMRVRTSTAVQNGIDIRLRDSVSGTIVTWAGAGGVSTAGYQLLGLTTNWENNIALEYNYTLPATGIRTIVVEFKRRDNTNTVTAQGSIVVTGCY